MKNGAQKNRGEAQGRKARELHHRSKPLSPLFHFISHEALQLTECLEESAAISVFRPFYSDELGFAFLLYGLPFHSDTIHKPWELPLGLECKIHTLFLVISLKEELCPEKLTRSRSRLIADLLGSV